MEQKLKHLEFIQNVITRMANNSFLLKGWAITLIVAMIGLSKDDLNYFVLAGVIIVTIIFWLLDGYYLFQERYFRVVYKVVSKKKPEDIDFIMIVDQATLKTNNANNHVSWLSAIFSKTITPYYLGLIILTLFLFFLI